MIETLIQKLRFVALGFKLMVAPTVKGNRMRELICSSHRIFPVQSVLFGVVLAEGNLFVSYFLRAVSFIDKSVTVFFLTQFAMIKYFYSEPSELQPAIASNNSLYARGVNNAHYIPRLNFYF